MLVGRGSVHSGGPQAHLYFKRVEEKASLGVNRDKVLCSLYTAGVHLG